MNRVLLALVSTALVASLLGLGCGSDEKLPEPAEREALPAAEKSAAQATQAPAPEAVPAPSGMDDAIRAEAAANLSARLRETVELPAYYPEDGPLYPNAEPSHVQQMPNGKVSVLFGTDASVEEAARVMAGAAEERGWTVATEDPIERGFLMRVTKDGRNAVILTNRVNEPGTEGATLVAVSIDP